MCLRVFIEQFSYITGKYKTNRKKKTKRRYREDETTDSDEEEMKRTKKAILKMKLKKLELEVQETEQNLVIGAAVLKREEKMYEYYDKQCKKTDENSSHNDSFPMQEFYPPTSPRSNPGELQILNPPSPPPQLTKKPPFDIG